MQLELIQALLIALALGGLVGLQREWSHSQLGGIRTFPLITAFGALAAVVGGSRGEWIIAAALLSLAAMLVVGNLAELKTGPANPGLTTEVAALVMFLVGVSVQAGYLGAALVVTGCVVLLLQWKNELHSFVHVIDEAELRAGARLVLLALVILPALPDTAYGPFGVLNPFRVWMIVVLIVGISLAAYISYRLFGERGGTLMAGLLGGLISSTATTVTYAAKAKQSRGLAGSSAAVIVLASAVVFGRMLIEIAIVAPGTLRTSGPPLLVMLMLMLLLAWLSQRRSRTDPAMNPDSEPPSTLRTAIAFGLLYALVLVAVATAREYFGRGGLYTVAGLSGLADVDAITLSTTQLVDSGHLSAGTGWRLILTGALSNLGFKGAIAAVAGPRELAGRLAIYFGTAIAAGAGLLVWWP